MSNIRVVAMSVLCVGVALGSLGVSVVSAQPAPAGAADFSGVGLSRTVAVIDDAGRETRGRVVRVLPDALTLSADGRTVVFERADVAAVHGLGDPLKNGMLIGLAVGGGLGLVSGALETECGGFFGESRACSADERFRLGAVGGVVVGLVGLGVGAAVDRAISRRTVLYARSPRAGTMAIGVAPWLTPTRASLRITAAW